MFKLEKISSNSHSTSHIFFSYSSSDFSFTIDTDSRIVVIVMGNIHDREKLAMY